MTIERVGYRRLYDSMGCSLANNKELEFQFSMGNIGAQIYMGPCPKYGIIVMGSTDKYYIPGITSTMMKVEYCKDASKSNYPRHFFTEIFCWEEVEVSQEISEAFHSKLPDAFEQLLSLARKDAEMLKSATDVIAGTIGLRYHWQFVLKIINENYIAIRNKDDFGHDMTSPAMRILEGPALNLNGEHVLTEELKAIGDENEKSRQQKANVFHWLIQAWTEDDLTSKFIDLFIPLEMVLAGYSGKMDEVFYQRIDTIRKIIEDNGSNQKTELLE